MSTLPSHPASARQTLSPFRLRRHADYGRVYKASGKYFSPSMAYFFRLRTADELSQGPRVGLTAGRVLGNAVARNRIKRRMREAVRLHLHLLHASVPAIDLVLHPRKSVLTLDFSALEREIAKVFTQAARLAVDPGARSAPRPSPKPTSELPS